MFFMVTVNIPVKVLIVQTILYTKYKIYTKAVHSVHANMPFDHILNIIVFYDFISHAFFFILWLGLQLIY